VHIFAKFVGFCALQLVDVAMLTSADLSLLSKYRYFSDVACNAYGISLDAGHFLYILDSAVRRCSQNIS